MRVSHALQTVAVAGLMGLGILGTSTTPALADHVRTQCDRDGDYCWRVWCDWDWDDCHRISGSGYHRYGYYNRSYYGNYYGGRGVVCDRDGDDCRRVYRNYDDDE